MEDTDKYTDREADALHVPKELITEKLIREKIRARLSRIDKELAEGFEIIDKHNNTVTIFGSARFDEDNPHYQKAREVSRALSEAGYVAVTGGGGGIMEAGNRGAYEQGGESLGFNIKLPHEQVLNDYTTESMPFKYFFTRKVIMTTGGVAYIYFPGGFGTFDELFEVITLIQTRKMPAAPIILVGDEFWRGLDDYIKKFMLDDESAISPEDVDLYTITEDTDEIINIINNHRDKILSLEV